MGCARSHDLRNTGRWYRKTLNGVEVRCCNACVKTVNNHVKFPRGGVTVCALCPATETSEFRVVKGTGIVCNCLLYTSPSPRDGLLSRMPSSA